MGQSNTDSPAQCALISGAKRELAGHTCWPDSRESIPKSSSSCTSLRPEGSKSQLASPKSQELPTKRCKMRFKSQVSNYDLNLCPNRRWNRDAELCELSQKVELFCGGSHCLRSLVTCDSRFVVANCNRSQITQ